MLKLDIRPGKGHKAVDDERERGDAKMSWHTMVDLCNGNFEL